MIPLCADIVAEPSDTACVEALVGLPPDLVHVFSDESRCVDPAGKSRAVFEELTEQFAFLGGSVDEYLRYLHRPDVQDLWSWVTCDEVRAYCGFSTVSKKDGYLRKILMPCPANYMFIDCRTLADQGLHGGGAFAMTHVPSDSWKVASSDQNSSFTRVRAPP